MALTFTNVKKNYQNGFTALKGINLTIQQGEFFALLGPNGAGKSTSIGIMTSLVTKTSGQVTIMGHDLDLAPSQAKACMGVVPQEINLNIFEKVENILLQQASFYGVPRSIARERVNRLLEQLGLTDKRTVSARMLSGGMKRRLMIARALMADPKILVLDEPTAGVDIEIRQTLWLFLRQLNQQGTTIILTTHYLEEAENLCNRVAIINQGEIIRVGQTQHLLAELDAESLILFPCEPISHPLELDPFIVISQDVSSIEVLLQRQQTITDLLAKLALQDIHIKSMRNKTSRLEQLFVNLVKDKSHAS